MTGTLPLMVRRAALLTDGASGAVEEFSLFGWPELLDLLTEQGPDELIRQVQAEDGGRGRRRHKQYDDATVAFDCE